jgi:hypothetical protein
MIEPLFVNDHFLGWDVSEFKPECAHLIEKRGWRRRYALQAAAPAIQNICVFNALRTKRHNILVTKSGAAACLSGSRHGR